MAQGEVVAAGAVVMRKGHGGREVLLIHRPRYDDWSFPKGKVDPGEHVLGAAVREVAEETGLPVRLGPALTNQRYDVAGRPKVVHYWTARVCGDDDLTGFAPNGEVDEVAWVPWGEADRRLTYPYDRDTLHEAGGVRRRNRAVIVLRHGSAVARKGWAGDDRHRPLTDDGCDEARQLVPLLAAYGVTRLVTSSSSRCSQTLEPYATYAGRGVEPRDALSEEDASAAGVTALVDELLEDDRGTVLCTHRPVLPTVLDALGIETDKLAPAEMVVVHHRRGVVLAVERHHPEPTRPR